MVKEIEKPARRGRPPIVRWASLAAALKQAQRDDESPADVEARVALALGVGPRSVRHWVIGEFLPDSSRLAELAGALAATSVGPGDALPILRELVSDMPETKRKTRAKARQ